MKGGGCCVVGDGDIWDWLGNKHRPPVNGTVGPVLISLKRGRNTWPGRGPSDSCPHTSGGFPENCRCAPSFAQHKPAKLIFESDAGTCSGNFSAYLRPFRYQHRRCGSDVAFEPVRFMSFANRPRTPSYARRPDQKPPLRPDDLDYEAKNYQQVSSNSGIRAPLLLLIQAVHN